jgi:hypothetical protein
MMITVAVNPLIADWTRITAESFNEQDTVVNSSRRVTVQIVSIDDLDVWRGQSDWIDGTLETGNRPSVWVPALAMSASYAQNDSRLQFIELEPSVAKTLLVWGGFEERTTALPDSDTLGFGWDTVAPAAEVGQWGALGADPTWQFIDLAFPAPDQTTSGLGVLLSGAAAYYETNVLTSQELRDESFRSWISPILTSVPNFSSLGNDPARAIAQRGLSIADMGLLPESQWIVNLDALNESEDFVFAYPEIPVVFDFPLLAWDSPNVEAEELAAAQAFADYLTSAAVQATLADYGLRGANGALPESMAALLAASPSIENAVQPPDRSAVQSILTWYGQLN